MYLPKALRENSKVWRRNNQRRATTPNVEGKESKEGIWSLRQGGPEEVDSDTEEQASLSSLADI